jgi:hypothetical protein
MTITANLYPERDGPVPGDNVLNELKFFYANPHSVFMKVS